MIEILKEYGINIKNKELLNTALTHSSYANEQNTISYERLEFLGDAVLQLAISEYIYKSYNLAEGAMSKLRASFVCEQALAFYSKQIGLDQHIKVGNGQLKNISDAIIADIFESILGAIYLECGFAKAKRFIYKIIVPYIKDNHQFFDDYKSLLQELIHVTKEPVEYNVISETGPAHNKIFVVEVMIGDLVYGRGKGKNKKQAEQAAALDAISKKAN